MFYFVGLDVPDEDGAVCRSHRYVVGIRTEGCSCKVAAHLEAVSPKNKTNAEKIVKRGQKVPCHRQGG